MRLDRATPRTNDRPCQHSHEVHRDGGQSGRPSLFPTKDVDVSSSSFANKRFCFVLDVAHGGTCAVIWNSRRGGGASIGV